MTTPAKSSKTRTTGAAVTIIGAGHPFLGKAATITGISNTGLFEVKLGTDGGTILIDPSQVVPT